MLPPAEPAGAEGAAGGGVEKTLAAAVVSELNWARANPAEVLALLRERLECYQGRKYFPPCMGGDAVLTQEGPAAVMDAMEFVAQTASVGSLDADVGLAVAAEDHVADCGYTGARTNLSCEGLSASDRLARYGKCDSFGEIVWYMQVVSTPRDMVINLIVNDGVPTRECREKIYTPAFTAVGVAIGSHCLYGSVGVMELVEAWKRDTISVDQRVKDGPVQADPEKLEAAKLLAHSNVKPRGVCKICEKEIGNGAPIVDCDRLGGKIHKDCFKCSMCQAPLTRVPCFLIDMTPFCKKCHTKRGMGVCGICGRSVRGSWTEGPSGSRVHPECMATNMGSVLGPPQT